MTKYGKIYAAFVMLLFLLPNAVAIIKGKESFPFTPAPMFGYYIGDSTKFYNFEYTAHGKLVDSTVVPYRYEHSYLLAISRMFFDKVYWSVDPGSPLGYYRNDNPKTFEKRMGNFCTSYFNKVSRDSVSTIQLDVVQYDRKYNQLAKHTVGYYTLATKKFTHTWKP